MIRGIRLRIRSILLRRRLEREMREEMDAHLERSVERLMERGLSPEAARRQALREFGNVTYLQEEGRNARGTAWLDALSEDSRFALRQFRRRWGTTAMMFIVLTLGIAISTLLFSYVQTYALLPPPAVRLDDDLVRIRGSQDAGAAGRGGRAFGYEEIEGYRGLREHFGSVAAWARASVPVDLGAADELRGLSAGLTLVSGDYFGVLGVRPALGAGLPATWDEGSGGMVAVIGHAAWERYLGGSPDAVGKTIQVSGVPVTIVGVAPPRFVGIGAGGELQLWLPLEARHLILPGFSLEEMEFRAIGRLRQGVGHEEATAAARVVAARAADPVARPQVRQPGTEVVPLRSANGDPMHERDVRAITVMLGLLALLVLAVTCTNVSALQVGLAMGRRHEIAVRLSLGASRKRVIRQLLTESAVLGLASGCAALGIVWAIFDALERRFPSMPMDLGVTTAAAAFTFCVALGAGVLFGLSPALHATRAALAGALKDSAAAISSTRLRVQRALVVAQVACTQPLVVLLAAVLLLVLGEFRPAEPSAFGERLISVRLWAPAAAGPAARDARLDPHVEARVHRLAAQLATVVGVDAVTGAATSMGELGGYVVHPADRIAGAPQDPVVLAGETAPPGYLAITGTRLLRGREFTWADTASVRRPGEIGAVIPAELAGRLWPGADPLGRRLLPASDSAAAAATLVVTGVVATGDAAAAEPGTPSRVYLPPATGAAPLALLVRTTGRADAVLTAVRSTTQEAVPEMMAGVRTIESMEAESRRTFRMVTSGVAASGFAALLLSAIGLYAVIAFAVGQRTREIAVRMAIGAPPPRIARGFIADGLRLSGLGLAIGLPLSLLGLHLYNGLAAGDSFPTVPLPPVTVIAMVGILVVTVTATFLPARRAIRVDPAVVLRRE